MAKRKKQSSKKPLAITCVILALLIIGIFAVMGHDFGFMDEGGFIVPVNREDGKINVLLLGVDVEGLRTDAIMVVSYDIKENKANMLSIPRDTRMYIGSRYQKINAAHAIGGMKGKIAGPEGTVEAVTRLTGIPINYYVEFSFSAIDHFSEALGPVTFDVPDVEGNGRGMNYEDPYQDLEIHLKPGEQELVGNQVQQLLRYRKSMYKDKNGNRLGYSDGDRGRVQMQQDFIKAVVDQKLNAGLILKLPDIFKSLSNDIKTNMSIAEIAKYSKYLQGFTGESISSYQLPGEGKMIGGGSYWVCDLEATAELVETVFGYDASKITIDSPDGKKKSSDSEKTTSKGSGKSTPKPAEAPKSADDDEVDQKLLTKQTPKPSAKPDNDEKESPKPDESAEPEEVDENSEKSDNAGGEATPKPTKKPDSSDKNGEDEDNVKSTPKPDNSDKKGNDEDAPKATAKPAEKPKTDTAPEEDKPARPAPNPGVSEEAVSLD